MKNACLLIRMHCLVLLFITLLYYVLFLGFNILTDLAFWYHIPFKNSLNRTSCRKGMRAHAVCTVLQEPRLTAAAHLRSKTGSYEWLCHLFLLHLQKNHFKYTYWNKTGERCLWWRVCLYCQFLLAAALEVWRVMVAASLSWSWLWFLAQLSLVFSVIKSNVSVRVIRL